MILPKEARNIRQRSLKRNRIHNQKETAEHFGTHNEERQLREFDTRRTYKIKLISVGP